MRFDDREVLMVVEVYDDAAVRRCPLTLSESLAMISDVKGARLLKGFRGRPPADVAALADTWSASRGWPCTSPAISRNWTSTR